jgi:hypothetical protein
MVTTPTKPMEVTGVTSGAEARVPDGEWVAGGGVTAWWGAWPQAGGAVGAVGARAGLGVRLTCRIGLRSWRWGALPGGFLLAEALGGFDFAG